MVELDAAVEKIYAYFNKKHIVDYEKAIESRHWKEEAEKIEAAKKDAER